MNRAVRPFRQADVTTALKGAKAAGLQVARAEIDREGKIVLVFGDPAKPAPTNAYDEWKASRNGGARRA